MADPFVGEIRMVAFSVVPKGWALCNGQLLDIAQNQALFALLGTAYGGDATRTFALPDLQGRIPVHVGNGVALGASGGETAHTLGVPELPVHTHAASAAAVAADQVSPAGGVWASGAEAAYAPSADNWNGLGALGDTGGGQPHPNMPPFLSVSFIIALTGIFPTRS